jgi:glycosyltransferase involved in cell wall biosynthesis
MSSESLPQISVIMPVYNSQEYLHEAVTSILAQTFTDFELIAVDDGSTDGSGTILESFRQSDARVIVQRHSQNRGVAAARNTGLALARGKYIACMDADDISLPERFEKQVAFLEMHPDLGILGSAVQVIDEGGYKIGALSAPLEDLGIRWASIFSTPFMQPTIMYRRSVMVEHGLQYRNTMEPADDFDFSIRLLEFARAANFAESFYIYRIHPASLTSKYGTNNVNRKSLIIYSNLQKLFPTIVISLNQVLQVSNAILGKPSELWKRAQAADDYLQVWQAFAGICTPNPDFYNLQNNVTVIAAKLTLYPPFQSGWGKTLRHIFELEPKWPIVFARKFPEMVSTKIHARLIRQNRK